MGSGSPKKKIRMGDSHSIRPNKAYMSFEVIEWLNDQDNANEEICRALEYFYRQVVKGENKAAIQTVESIKRPTEDIVEVEEITVKKTEPIMKQDASQIGVSAEALDTLSKLKQSLKR